MFTPQYNWNIAKVGVKHQSINPKQYLCKKEVDLCKSVLLLVSCNDKKILQCIFYNIKLFYCNHLVRLSVRSHFCNWIFHVCRNENFRNSYLSFYWKKWFYIWYMALAWWLVPGLPFPGLPHIYFLFTVQLTNGRVGVFLARRSVQHLVSNMAKWLLFYLSFAVNLEGIQNKRYNFLWCVFKLSICMSSYVISFFCVWCTSL